MWPSSLLGQPCVFRPPGTGAEVTPTQPATAACQPHTNRCLGAAALAKSSWLCSRESDLPWRLWLPTFRSLFLACCCSLTKKPPLSQSSLCTFNLSRFPWSHFSPFVVILSTTSSNLPFHFFSPQSNDWCLKHSAMIRLTLMKDNICLE